MPNNRTMHSSEILTKMKLSDVFHLPKTFGNFHGKVHRVKNVFYLTQVAFVYDLVTKIQDGTTDIAVNNLKLVILCEWNMLFHHKISTGKQECLFKIPLIPQTFQWNARKTCVPLKSQQEFPGKWKAPIIICFCSTS